MIYAKIGRFADNPPLVVRFAVLGATALKVASVLFCSVRQSVGTLVDRFALRNQVSDGVHTLFSRFFSLRHLLL
jgi:hypothetical protein